ncbi:hypothetical protein J4772_35545 [Cohnella sp. LGH]|uniref:hypothetical protein n=2 Tax=Paenibacillaceae TaxID=186822 RepID=UPI001ADAFCFC|nr:hypothetical protein [Cohnella sp. LGH]QTH42710.1 hypothetical protein J4772_35545 [Cohnella sp. LGH]
MRGIGEKVWFIAAILILFLVGTVKEVKATSWVDLEPEEVMKRSKVVVKGVYDFSKTRKGSDFIWVGYNFHVEHVYKGHASDPLIVGIDGFDVGWADEFQQKQGKFLLFLEQAEGADFLTPVAGPNGMIQLLDGQVQHHNEKERESFSRFLKSAKGHPPDQTETSSNDSPVAILIVVALAVVAALYAAYRWRKRKESSL